MPPRKLVFLFCLLALMEMLAGFTLLVGSSLTDVPGMGYGVFWLMLAAACIGTLAGVVLNSLSLRLAWTRIILMALCPITACTLSGLTKHGILALTTTTLVLAVAYWRGLAVTENPPAFEDVQLRFAIGFAFLFAGLIWVVARGIISQSSIWQMLAVVGVAYTVVGLIALVTARLERLREPGTGPAVGLAVAIQLAILVGAAFGALQLFSVDLAAAFWNLTHPVWDAMGAVAFDIVRLIAGPIDWVVSLVRPHHPPIRPQAPITSPEPPNGTKRPLHAPRGSNTPLVILSIALVTIVFAALCFVIWRVSLRWERKPAERGFDEQRKALVTPSQMWRALLLWLRSRLSRGARATVHRLEGARKRAFRADLPADPVRRIYAQLLRRAAAAGLPRPSDATPTEYQQMLASRWPAGSAAFAALTNAYVLRRYGGLILSSPDSATLKPHWRDARAALRRPPPTATGDAGAGLIPPATTRPAPFANLWQRTRNALLVDPDTGEARNLLILIASVVGPVTILFLMLILLTFVANH